MVSHNGCANTTTTSSTRIPVFLLIFANIRITFLLFLILIPSSSLQLCNTSHSESDLSQEFLQSRSASQKQGLFHITPSFSTRQISPLHAPKAIKTPSGTVKCSCQTVADDESTYDSYSIPIGEDGKSIEIEIHQPEIEEEDQIKSEIERQSDNPLPSKKPAVRNSFTVDWGDFEGEDENSQSQDRLFSTEGPPNFLSYLSAFYKPKLHIAEGDREIHSEQDSIDSQSPVNGESSSKNFPSHHDHYQQPSHSSLAATISSTSPSSFIASTTTSPPPLLLPYNAFRNSEFSTNHSPIAAISKENVDTHGHAINSEDKKYFTWDFVYGHNKQPPPSVLKPAVKREFLYLGSIIDSFKGPRKRRRRSLIGNRSNSKSPPVVFVYPSGYNNVGSRSDLPKSTLQNHSAIEESKDESKTSLPVAKEESKLETRSEPPIPPPPPVFDAIELETSMDEALARAWSEYGTGGIHSPTAASLPTPLPPPPSSLIPSNNNNALQEQIDALPPPHPMQVALHPLQQISPGHVQVHHYTPPRPFLFIDRIFNPFQPMNSEWDKHISVFPGGRPPPPPEPGFFSRFLASYIDFEVNNHETADLMRRVVFALFVGFLIVGWIFFGIMLGVIPLKKWLKLKVAADEKLRSEANGKDFKRDTSLTDLTEKILLSLDADWLKQLEERVMSSGGGLNPRKIPIQVFCCILPDESVHGMVECQVSKNYFNQASNNKKGGGGKKSAFKCITDLIYNFQFGPKEGSQGGDLDNTVNSKGKADNSNTFSKDNNSNSTTVL